jgi:hypothetical protein
VLAAAPRIGAQGSVPVVGVREEVNIASNDSVPGMQLTAIEDLVVLVDGRIITTHPRESVVRVFDPRGRLLKVVGRPGDGPGEFQRIRQVGYVGSVIWVEDQSWYQLFDAGTYEPAGRVPRGPTGGSFLGLISDSTSFHYRWTGDSGGITIYDRTGQRGIPVDIALRRAGHQFQVQVQEINPAGMLTGRIVPQTRTSPLSTSTRLSLVPGGREVVVLEASEVWNGPPGQFTIRRVDATGHISSPVTVSLPVRRVTSSEADSLVKASAPPVRAPRDARPVEEYLAKAKVPAIYPAFQSFMPSADSVVWLTEHAMSDTRLVVDFTGKPLMRVRLPKDLRVTAVSRTHVWGVIVGENDRPIIYRYRVQ